MTEKPSTNTSVSEASPSDVLGVTSDAAVHVSMSSVTTVATNSEALPVRPLIPFGQGWLSTSCKSRDGY